MGSLEELQDSLGRQIIAAVIGNDNALMQLIDTPLDIFAPEELVAWQYLTGWFGKVGFAPGPAQLALHFSELELPKPAQVAELLALARHAAGDRDPREGPSEPRRVVEVHPQAITPETAPAPPQTPQNAAQATSERWLPVSGYEGSYEVSDRGRVRSRDRWVRSNGRGTYVVRGQMLKQNPDHNGYLQVHLSKNGQQETYEVHTLVLNAFVGPCPPGQECCHGPGGKQDNRWPENLEWGTRHKNNYEDKRRDGTLYNVGRGSNHPKAKLTEADVLEIRARYAVGGVSRQELADEFGMTKTPVGRIIRGESWKHVEPEVQTRVDEPQADEIAPELTGAVAKAAVARLTQATDDTQGRVAAMFLRGTSTLELSRLMGISKPAMQKKLLRMERRGVLQRKPGSGRTADVWYTVENHE